MKALRLTLWACLILATSAQGAEDLQWKKAFLTTRAGDAYSNGRFAEAKKLFISVLQFDDEDEIALLHLGAMAKRENALAEAQKYFLKGATAHPQSFALQQELGAVLMALKRPAEAVEHFRLAAAVNAKSVDAWVNLGDALSLSGRRGEAWPAYENAIGADPQSTWARRQAGFCAFETGRLNETIEHLSKAEGAFKQDFNIPLVMGHAQAKLGNDAEALARYRRAMELQPKSDQGPLFAGLALERMGRIPEAQKYLEQAVALKPDYDVSHVHLGNLYRRIKQTQKARAEYNQALKASPKSIWALMQLGFLELESGAAEKAKSLLKRAMAIAPDNADVGVALGDAYQLLHQDAEALKVYQTTLNRHPTHLAAMVKTADVLSRTNPSAGFDLYQQAVKLYPKSAWARISLGDAFRRQGDLKTALVHYREALAADPRSAWAQRQLGYAYFEMGEWVESEKWLLPLSDDGDADLWQTLGHLSRKRKANLEAIAWYERARRQDGKRPQLLLALSDALLENNDFANAEATARAALALDAKLAAAWILLGDIARTASSRSSDEVFIQAQFLSAKDSYAHALEVEPGNGRAARQLGVLQYELKEDESALKLLTQARSSFPEDGELALVFGHVAVRRGEAERGRIAYLDATHLLPDDVRPWVFAGRAALMKNLFSEADALFVSALKIDPKSGWAHLERGYGQRSRRDWPGALISAEAATRFSPKNPEAWLFLGRLHQEQGRVDDAIAAYEEARFLSKDDPLADRALASALTHKGQVDGLLKAETLLTLPLKDLGAEGFTHAVAGYLFVKLVQTSELSLPTPEFPLTRKTRRDGWMASAVSHLMKAVELSPDDRHMRLASAVGLSEIKRYPETREMLKPLLSVNSSRCPKTEWEWRFEETAETRLKPIESIEQAQALEEAQLLSEAHLLAGDIDAMQDPMAARLRYFCALAFMPFRADAHLRLGASYESIGLTRLAEEHFLAATKIEPKNALALQSLGRLRKEGGIPVGPVRFSGQAWFLSDFVSADVQARLAKSLGANDVELQRKFLTTPRNLGASLEGSWQKKNWGSKLRLGVGYSFSYGFNSLLNDQVDFENRRAHLIDAFAVFRPLAFKDRRYDVYLKGGYRLVLANTPSRSEIRNSVFLEGRILREGWGTLDADLFYALGLFRPTPGSLISDPLAHNFNFGIRANPLIRRYQIEPTVGLRIQVAWLRPSNRHIWVNEFNAGARKNLGPIFVGGDFRLGQTFDSIDALSSGVNMFSLGPRALGGFRWNGYSGVWGRVGPSFVPGMSVYDNMMLGVSGEHRVTFRGFGLQDQGLAVSASYDVRYTYRLGRAEHLFNLMVIIGR